MVVVFDLDDTLYDEINFVRSGFAEIASYLGDRKYFDFLWEDFMKKGSGKNIDNLLSVFKIKEKKEKLIEIYRFHTPNIELNNDARAVLHYLKEKKISTAIITDGHYITQKNKFTALGLDKLIDFVVFTDYYHTKKPDLRPFHIVMSHFSKEKYFCYIADNPQKDFIAPLKLGWKAVRYKNKNGVYNKIKCALQIPEISNLMDAVEILGLK
ncbi:HAD family hydrolase [Hippea sp. KM1]|uniref:HAD family hydrolase n=1 Tax=Hippea sp. KM1 TaxID=944481 RepID=UPI00046D662A|nr:HAD family hydrolase [Hippea sp. KM1]